MIKEVFARISVMFNVFSFVFVFDDTKGNIRKNIHTKEYCPLCLDTLRQQLILIKNIILNKSFNDQTWHFISGVW